MKRDLGELEITRLILHKVPQRLSKKKEKEIQKQSDVREQTVTETPSLSTEVEFSEVESPLTPQTRNYFTERIQTSLRTHTMYANFDPACETPVVAGAVHNCFSNTDVAFVEQSKVVAQHLYDSQNATNSGGLVLVAQASIEKIPAVAILKLEEESAIQFRREMQEGKPTFTLNHLGDLTMTQNTKVFKAGLFVCEGTTIADIEGHVSDKQQGLNDNSVGVADFFLRKFLGCVLRDDPTAQTLRAVDLTMKFLNTSAVHDPSEKADLLEAFQVRMRNNESTFSFEEYVENDVPPEYQDAFLNHLQDNGIQESTIIKDPELVRSRLKNAVWEFTNGVRVSFPDGAFREQYVSVDEGENGMTIMTVVGETKRLK